TQLSMPLERVLGKREFSAGAMPHTIAGILPERRTDIHDFSSARHLDSFLNDPFLNLLDLIPQEHHDSAGGGVAKSSGANIDTEREMPHHPDRDGQPCDSDPTPNHREHATEPHGQVLV